MRWLAIHLPLLPLQSLATQGEARCPLAISETQGRQQRILLCFVPAMHLVNKQQGALASCAPIAGTLKDLPQLSHARENR